MFLYKKIKKTYTAFDCDQRPSAISSMNKAVVPRLIEISFFRTHRIRHKSCSYDPP